MNGEIYDDLEIEKIAKNRFGADFDIDKVYGRNIPVGRSVNASVFLTTKNKLYTLISGATPLTLGDVQKIIRRMGLVAEDYLPPKNKPNYFGQIAIEKFKNTYPGRHHISDDDLRFYRLMAPYSPALVNISAVRDGTIWQFDSMTQGSWRPAVKIQYRVIKME